MQLSYLRPQQNQRHFGSTQVRAAAVAALLVMHGATLAQETAAPPDFAVVEAAVEAYFTTVPDYEPGDLIARTHVTAVLAQVADAGWKVPDADKIAELALPDNSFLVVQFKTPSGRRFMRKIASDPGAYPRVDRLSSIPRGQTLVNDLIRKKGGDELIRYMATQKGGHNMGRQLAAVPRGVDINKPTGRIYTAEDLLEVLRKL